MKVKLFGDTIPINWQELNIHMPFAPMHELAEKYAQEGIYSFGETEQLLRPSNIKQDICRTFEITNIHNDQIDALLQRINIRTCNTTAALDQATPDTICINLGGGMHHAGKYPKDGYAYSLINDIIWAVDYQLEQNKTVGVIDLDFHFGGGTFDYYDDNHTTVFIADLFHYKGVLHKHTKHANAGLGLKTLDIVDLVPVPQRDKYLLNIGTDWYKNDALFGQFGNMEAEDLLNVWKETVRLITVQNIPLAITMGGGYGEAGLPLYDELISWLRSL